MEFTLAERPYPMPVGRVSYLHMGPMTFTEFLRGHGMEGLAKWVDGFEWSSRGAAVDPVLHGRLLEALRLYQFVGGMPEAVSVSHESSSLRAVSDVQAGIIETYRDDFQKYAARRDLVRMLRVFNFAARQAGQKVKYSNISAGDQSATLRRDIELLAMARVISKVTHSHCSGLPLQAEAQERVFKLIFLDVGLMNALCGLSWSVLAARLRNGLDQHRQHCRAVHRSASATFARRQAEPRTHILAARRPLEQRGIGLRRRVRRQDRAYRSEGWPKRHDEVVASVCDGEAVVAGSTLRRSATVAASRGGGCAQRLKFQTGALSPALVAAISGRAPAEHSQRGRVTCTFAMSSTACASAEKCRNARSQSEVRFASTRTKCYTTIHSRSQGRGTMIHQGGKSHQRVKSKQAHVGSWRRKRLSVAVSAIVGTAASVPAAELETLIVTATKRAESAQEVSIALQAITGDSLRELRRRDLR